MNRFFTWIARLFIPAVVLGLGVLLFSNVNPAPRWTVEGAVLHEEYGIRPIPRNGLIVWLAQPDGQHETLACLDPRTGVPRWRSDETRRMDSVGENRSLSSADPSLIDLRDGKIVSIDLETGRTWRADVSTPDEPPPAPGMPIRVVNRWAGIGGRFVFETLPQDRDGKVHAVLDVKTNRTIDAWVKNTADIASRGDWTFRLTENPETLEIYHGDKFELKKRVPISLAFHGPYWTSSGNLRALVETERNGKPGLDIVEISGDGISAPVGFIPYPKTAQIQVEVLYHDPRFVVLGGFRWAMAAGISQDPMQPKKIIDDDGNDMPGEKSGPSFLLDSATLEPVLDLSEWTVLQSIDVSADRKWLRVSGKLDKTPCDGAYSLENKTKIAIMSQDDYASGVHPGIGDAVPGRRDSYALRKLDYRGRWGVRWDDPLESNEVFDLKTKEVLRTFFNGPNNTQNGIASFVGNYLERTSESDREIAWLAKLPYFSRWAKRTDFELLFFDPESTKSLGTWVFSTYPHNPGGLDLMHRMSLPEQDGFVVQFMMDNDRRLVCYDLPARRNWLLILGIPAAVGAGLYALVFAVKWWRRKPA